MFCKDTSVERMPRIKKSILVGIILLEILVFVWLYVYGNYGLCEIAALQKENDQHVQAIQNLKQEIADCKQQLQNLSRPFYQEKIAREQLQMAHKHDTILLLK
jgi:cell division protein FtsB